MRYARQKSYDTTPRPCQAEGCTNTWVPKSLHQAIVGRFCSRSCAARSRGAKTYLYGERAPEIGEARARLTPSALSPVPSEEPLERAVINVPVAEFFADGTPVLREDLVERIRAKTRELMREEVRAMVREEVAIALQEWQPSMNDKFDEAELQLQTVSAAVPVRAGYAGEAREMERIVELPRIGSLRLSFAGQLQQRPREERVLLLDILDRLDRLEELASKRVAV